MLLEHEFVSTGRTYRWNGAIYMKKVAILQEGSYFGEQALVGNKKRNATVYAETAVEVATLNRAKFKECMEL